MIKIIWNNMAVKVIITQHMIIQLEEWDIFTQLIKTRRQINRAKKVSPENTKDYIITITLATIIIITTTCTI